MDNQEREEIREIIKEETKHLATREELQKAIAPLATHEEMQKGFDELHKSLAQTQATVAELQKSSVQTQA
ncbi:MAG: hypothetical protein HZB52_16585, partial [Chloroflexi bacterium]|nr:hypothetical protein [Chloroflexota bacterium]